MRTTGRTRFVVTAALGCAAAIGLALTWGCGGDGGGGGGIGRMGEDQASRSNSFGSSESSVFADTKQPVEGDAERKAEDGPYLREVWISPDPPIASEPLTVTPKADNPAGGTLMFSYRWWVDGDELRGVRGDRLNNDRFKRGDRIEIEITAKDINGRSDTHKFSNITVANSTPQIVSVLPFGSGLDGLVMQAMDPDGDPVEWRIEGAPPGVAIERRSGRVSVDTSQVYATGTYTMKFVARDPAGGEGSLTVDANLSGSKQATREYVETPDSVVKHGSEYSDEEYEERAEHVADLMEKMSDEELEAYLNASEEAARDLEAAAATELPARSGDGAYGGSGGGD